MIRVSLCALVLGWFAWPLATATAQSVQLADGRVLLADVETADGQGLRVKRLDNGGMLDLRWDHLSAASALTWKRKFNLAGDTQDELTVRADEVEYLLNGSKQTMIGRIVDKTSEHLVVQVKGEQRRVPHANLRAVRKVDVPVAQVLTKDEFYAERLQLMQPGAEADKHMLLADDLFKVRDYDRATEHVQKAKELGNSKNPPQIDAMLAKLQRFKEAEKELKLLAEIQAARSRGQLLDFEKGGKLVLQFEKDFPQTKLKAEFETEKKRFADARKHYLTMQVAEQWRRSIQIVCEKAIADASLTLQAAKDYAQNKMTDDIVARLVTTMKLDATEIKALWAARSTTVVGKRTEHFSYMVGSWVLGAAAILKGTETGKAIDKQKGEKEPAAGNREEERFAKLLRQALDRRRQAVQGAAEGPKEQTDEDWWRQAERAERIGWLRAFYAESGGQLVVTFASVSACISCYGEGTVLSIGGDGKPVNDKCFLCQDTKWIRSFKAY